MIVHHPRGLHERVADGRAHEAEAALPKVRVLLALGQIAHVAAARALGLPPTTTKFWHGAEATAADGRLLLSSYHCSRYNQNTGRLDRPMFEAVFERALSLSR
jgi:uracil-DNA glycosylase